MSKKTGIKGVAEETQPKETVIDGIYEGLPYVGPTIHLKDTDEITSVLKLNQVLHVQRFDLSDEDEVKAYEEVCQKIQNGHAQLSYEEREYDEKSKQWVALVRWIDWWYSPAGDKK